MASHQYVFNMQGLSKTWPGGKKVFENIQLSFLPTAKIGVVGVNGSGKSTLLRIMAGEDTEFNGEANPADGVTIGYLPQEPTLDESLSVLENIASKCPEKILVDKFNAISMKLGEDYTDELMEEMTALQEQVDAADAWILTVKSRWRWKPCAARWMMPMSRRSQAAKCGAWRSVSSCSPNLI